jgi:hypothetical protein
MQHRIFIGTFLFTLYGLLFTACDRHDTDSQNETAVGVVSFGVNSPSLTKGSGGDSGWKTVNMPLSHCERKISTLTDSSSEIDIVAKPDTASYVLTRGAPVTGTSSPAGSIGVLGYLLLGGTWNESTAIPDFMYNTQLTRTGSPGSYTYSYYPAKFWPDNTNDKVRFFAYYPYNGDDVTLSLQTATGCPTISYTSGSTVTNQVDLMYAHASAVNNKTTGSSVNLAFSHALTRVSFSAKLAAGYTSQVVVIQSIQITGLKSGGTLSLDPSDATPWTLGAGTASYNLSTNNGALIPTANQALNKDSYKLVNSYTGYLLCPPQSVTTSNTIVVSYTVDGVANTATYSLPATTWSMGQSVNFQLTLPDPFVTANCYIVAPDASFTFPVNVKGNYDSYTAGLAGIPTIHTTSSVGILWQTGSTTLINSISFNVSSQTATITTGSSEGNAVVAAYDNSSNILWSWHIWITDEPAYITVNGNVWMDRNLGATAIATNTSGVTFATCGGLMYQWGRKDPFPGSNGSTSGNSATAMPIFNTTAQMTNSSITYSGFTPTATGTTGDVVKYISVTTSPLSYATQCEYSIKYPLLFLLNWAGSTATATATYTTEGGKSSWGGEYGESKSIFDPCPPGWRVPSGRKSSSTWASPWSTWTTTQPITTSTYASLKWNNTYDYFYPATGYRIWGEGSLYGVGDYGDYWPASVYDINGYALNFYNNSVSPSAYLDCSRSYGYTVRCVQE